MIRMWLRWLCRGIVAFIIIMVFVGQAMKYGAGAVIFMLVLIAAFYGAVLL